MIRRIMRDQTEKEALDLVELLSTARELRAKLQPFLKEEFSRSTWQQVKDIFTLRKQDGRLIDLWNSLVNIETWAIQYKYEK